MIKAFWIGFADGWEQPYEITMGMTYDSPARQWAWDWGANIGQFIRSCGKTRAWRSN